MNKEDMAFLVRTVQYLDKLAIDNNFAAIDNIIQRASFSEMSGAEIIIYIRCTFAYRDRLQNWKSLVQRYADYLDKTGKDKKTVLKGLEKYYE